MKLYFIIIISLTLIIVIPDIWLFFKMKERNHNKWLRNLSLTPGTLFILSFLYIRFGLVNVDNYKLTTLVMWLFYALLIIYVPKTIFLLFYYINKLYNSVFKRSTRIIRHIGSALGLLFVVILVYGTFVTRDNFYLKEQTVYVEDLPKGFEGYRIVVFSDMHLGSWNGNYSIMDEITEMINSQKPDIIIFAGDMVNNFAEETEGWTPYFKKLKSNYGKYAVLGNHDYGDYSNWKSKDAKQQNFKNIISSIEQFGFDLLNNEHTELVCHNDTITLLGTENYGSGHFNSYSDLPKALTGTKSERKKILITHDPNHWRGEVVGQHQDIFLTIAGHTHAAQIGFSREGFQLSPASVIYPEWDGLYQKGSQQIYVNRGSGYVGIPARIGVPPEITLIILKAKKL